MPAFQCVTDPREIPNSDITAVGDLLICSHNFIKLSQNMVISFLRGNIIVLQIFVDKIEIV